MAKAELHDMQRRAAIEDEKPYMWPIVGGFFATAILIAVIFEMRGSNLHVLIGIATILLSWFFLNTMFALHYAHDYYREIDSPQGRKTREGLLFPGQRKPDYWDFLYFATSFGAASQTSDVSILTKPLRRLATLHAIISFSFNTAVLALTINLAVAMI